jgi:hypothetical protein
VPSRTYFVIIISSQLLAFSKKASIRVGLTQEQGQVVEKEAIIFGKGFRATCSPPAPLPKMLRKS